MKSILSFLLILASTACMALADGGAPLRNGDTVDIRLSGVPADEASAFSASYPIDDQGNINLPYINTVKVGGLLPNQIQEVIQNRLIEAEIFTHPTVVVQQNTPRFVNVAGEVRAPQRIPFTADMTLMTALNAAGWFSDFADQSKIHLIREGKSTTYSAKAIRKDPGTDPKLLPGDQIQVPQSFW
jgi:protein involved in polysaccharide export with SLBB domain